MICSFKKGIKAVVFFLLNLEQIFYLKPVKTNMFLKSKSESFFLSVLNRQKFDTKKQIPKTRQIAEVKINPSA